MKLGIHIMAPKPIPTAYFINPSHHSARLCVSLTVARQRLRNIFKLLFRVNWAGGQRIFGIRTRNFDTKIQRQLQALGVDMSFLRSKRILPDFKSVFVWSINPK
jgi:hypothetical protein